MEKDKSLLELATQVFEFKKQNGFSKRLSNEIQIQAVELCNFGFGVSKVSRAIGVPGTTVASWIRKFDSHKVNTNNFSEVKLVEELNSNVAIKLATTVQGCRVEFFGSDYALLQKILAKVVDQCS